MMEIKNLRNRERACKPNYFRFPTYGKDWPAPAFVWGIFNVFASQPTPSIIEATAANDREVYKAKSHDRIQDKSQDVWWGHSSVSKQPNIEYRPDCRA
jgi:hypothetical protein